ncbi:amino acid adenylation domain-containing protein [Shimazuella sp. AN120528]|uniref:non-ribosomal peptide synthetase n=1 Tax=Shimazuella soli TaxID=1892854 RepID=UPI001F0D33E2|nr:non-ribosomal peptide synthetase [Shimazuella soli]MCH5584990.1 amino acid adenylation domain-containing protein [Shimazuella soli]
MLQEGIQDVYPLTPAQQGILFHSLDDTIVGVYVNQLCLRLHGCIDLIRFEQAWKHIVQRHDVFRTAFFWEELSAPLQVVSEEGNIPFETKDWSHLTEKSQEESWRKLLIQDRELGFDLQEAPLTRVTMIKVAEKQYRILWTFHHLLLDGWSCSIVLKELLDFYYGRTDFQESVAFSEFVAWIEANDQSEALDYWGRQVTSIEEPTLLSDQKIHEQSPLTIPSEHNLVFSIEQTKLIRQIAKQLNITESTLLLGAWMLTVSLFTSKSDIVVGMAVSGRSALLENYENRVGMHMNTVPVHGTVTCEDEIQDWLQKLQQKLLDIRMYEHTSLADIGAYSQVAGDVSLFDNLFVYENYPSEEWKQEDFSLVIEESIERSHYPLTLMVIPNEEIRCRWIYNSTLSSTKVNAFASHFRHILLQMLAMPDQSLSSLEWTTIEEKQQIFSWNQSDSAFILSDERMHQLLEKQVGLFSDKIAIRWGIETITYQELNNRSNQLARLLLQKGIQAGDVIAVGMPRSIEMVIAIYAIWKMGGAYLPIDLTYPEARLSYILSDAKAKLMISTSDVVFDLPAYRGETILYDQVTELLASLSSLDLQLEGSNMSLAYVIYTSGSTGEPKGVMINHCNAVHLMQWASTIFSPEERAGVLASTSICFDLSVFELFFPLSNGGMVIGVENILELAELNEKEQVTLINTVPSAIAELLELDAIPSNVKTVNLAGEPLTNQLAQKLYELGHVEKVYNLYGPTEDTTYSTYSLVEKGSAEIPAIGRPIDHTEVFVMNEYGKLMPIGIPGELYIGGAGVSAGYLNHPTLTAEKFVNHPFRSEEKLYRTGDRAVLLENGEFKFLGRLDHQVKIRGFRIEPAEIEHILEKHQGVTKAIVVAKENQLIAYVIGQGYNFDFENYLTSFLPSYMVPNHFIEIDEFPLTPNGKIDRKALLDRQIEQVNVILPTNDSPLEEILKEVWKEVLGLTSVSTIDNFFALGGHSLLATQVISRISRIFQVTMPIRSLFQSPTIKQLARDLDQMLHTHQEENDPIRRYQHTEKLPLSPSQKRIWFLEQVLPFKHVYHLPFVLKIEGHIEKQGLERAICYLIDRHPALRTSFYQEDGVPYQLIEETLSISLEEMDVRSAKSPEQEAKLQIEKEIEVPFSLDFAPLIRVKLYRLADDEFYLFFLMHHLIADGWSLSILSRELFQVYESILIEKDIDLPTLPLEPVDYALYLEELAESTSWNRKISYWKEKLLDLPSLVLPTDFPRPNEQSYEGNTLYHPLSVSLSEDLKVLSNEQGCTLYMVLLSAFQVLLSRYTGQTDIVVGSPVAGRNDEQLEGLIGFFVETIVIRTDLNKAATWTDLLQLVREVSLEAYANSQVPFEKVVDAIAPDRKLGESPLFQIMFAMQSISNEKQTNGNLVIQHIPVPLPSAKFDLTLTATEQPEGIFLTFEYNRNLFEEKTIRRIMKNYEHILQEMVRDLDQKFQSFSLLCQEEEELLHSWSVSEEKVSSDFRSLTEQIQAQVEIVPEGLAVVEDQKSLSYLELEQQSTQLALFLRSIGVGKHDRVAICSHRCPELVVVLLGVMKLGACYVPLDPTYPLDRLAFMIEDSGASVLLTQHHLTGWLDGLATTTFVMDKHPVSWDHMPIEAPFSPIEENQLAYMVYTSGSTGLPKGVCITHGGLHNLVQWHRQSYQLTIEDRTTMLAGPAFDAAVWEIWPTLAAGGTLIIPNEEKKADPTELRDWLISQGITISFIPTPLLAQLLSIPWANGGSLRYLLTGGDQLHVYPPDDFPVPIYNHYGPTENTVVTTAGLVPSKGIWSPSIGKPIYGVRTHVLDENGLPVPIGVPGELCIGGNQLAARYHELPEKTEQSFIQHPIYGRLYKTGDRVKMMADGNLQFQGRIDRQVSIRGYRVELGEIEATLAQLDRVHESVVLVVNNNLVAYVEMDGDDTQYVKDELAQKLPAYMLPKLFIFIPSLPLTENGKLDRANLPEPKWDQLVDENVFVAPCTKIECQLAEIWEQLLNIEQVSVNDNFFQLGGDSIISIQMVARAKNAGIAITAKQVFSHQTILELSKVAKLVQETKHDQGLIVGEVSLTPIQTWFFEQQMDNPNHFNQAMLLILKQPLSASIFTAALEKLMEHHDSFRLRFVETDRGWRQSYSTISASVPFQVLDISSLSEEEQMEAIKQVGQRTQTSLHLNEGPVFRAIYFKHAIEQADKLLLVAHHLIIDGVSWRIILEDLSDIYQQLEMGKEPVLSAKTTSYQAWSNTLLKLTQSRDWAKEIAFWNEQQVGKDELLPVCIGESENMQTDAKEISFRLTKELTRQLVTQSFQAYRAHVSELLLASLVNSYHAWSGNDTVSIDLEGHGREESIADGTDLSRTIGWFTTIYPVKFNIEAEKWEQLVPIVQRQLSHARKQGITYGMLKYLKMGELSSSSQISFNYLGQFQADPDSIWETSTSEGIGSLIDPAFRRPYALDVWSAIQDDQLQVKFTYDPLQFSKVQITSWITLYQQQLNLLIQHCMAKKPQPMLVDFPSAKLSTEELLKVPKLSDVKSIYPLSPLQEGMLFHSLYENDKEAYVIQMTMKITGELNVTAFREAWNQLVERHPQLTVSIWWKGVSTAHQIAWNHLEIPIHQMDWSDKSRVEQEQLLTDFLVNDRKKGFELTEPPLMRVEAITIGKQEHRLVWSYHHVLLDGWSMPIVLDELLEIYQSLLTQHRLQLPSVGSYEQYFEWLSEQDEELAKSYWSHQLADASAAVIAIQADDGSKSAHEEWVTFLSDEWTEQIKLFAKQQKVTMNTVIQAVWGIFLSAYSGQSHLLYGTTVSGRPGSLNGVEQIVGPFISTVPVRIDLNKNLLIDNYLIGLQQQLKDTEEYAYIPLTKIADWAGAGAEEPLFHYLLVMENYQMSSLEKESVQISELKGIENSHYPLVLVVSPGERLFFKWMYDSSSFNEATIKRFMRLFTSLLQQFVQSNDGTIAELNFLLEEEKEKLQNWHQTKEVSNPLSVLERIVIHATESPDHIAIESPTGTLTYGELYQNAAQLAYYLRMAEVKPEDCVGVLLDRSIELVISLVAIHLLGATYVPIDPAYPENRINSMIQNSGMNVIITDSSFQSKCEASHKHLICMDTDKANWISMPTIHTRLVQPHHLAYVVYTSGSTGDPKGVEITHSSLQQLVDWHQATYELTREDRCSMLAGVGFDASAWEIWTALASGSTLIIGEEENRLSPSRLKNWLIQANISISFVPTVICEAFFQLDWPSATSLRVLLTGGDQLRRYPPASFPIKVVNHYGPTENTVVATSGVVYADGDRQDLPSIGFPIAGTSVAVVNEFGQQLPIGVPGELWLSGKSLANGYRKQRDLTIEKFIHHSQLGRVYQTGDIVRYGMDGQLLFIGRKDNQVQLRGYRIELGEIEAVLMEHEEVTQAVVLMQEQANGEKVLHAFVVANRDLQTEMLTLIKQKLPDYMHPSSINWLMKIPITENGKIDKASLLDLEIQPTSSYVAPSTPMEQRLVSIWEEVIGSKQKIGIEDNFFQLGGHSLMATQIITRVNELYRCNLPLKVLFESPTIHELVKQIKQNLLRKASVRKG